MSSLDSMVVINRILLVFIITGLLPTYSATSSLDVAGPSTQDSYAARPEEGPVSPESKESVVEDLISSASTPTRLLAVWTLSLDVVKFAATILGLALVIHQLRINRRASKDKLVYDVNKGLEAYSHSVKYCEYILHALSQKSAHFNVILPTVYPKGNTGAEADRIFKSISTLTRSQPYDSAEAKPGTYNNLRNMLRTFETVMLMLETRLVHDSDIFPLIGYRVALVVNCPLVQSNFLYRKGDKNEIIPNYRFSAVFALYHRLMIYNACLYEKVGKDASISIETLLDELPILKCFEISGITKWDYDDLSKLDGEESRIELKTWKGKKMVDLEERLKKTPSEELDPYYRALLYYFLQKPQERRRFSAILDWLLN